MPVTCLSLTNSGCGYSKILLKHHIEIRTIGYELSGFGNVVQRNNSYFAIRRSKISFVNAASIKYSNGSFLWAVGTDTNEYVSRKYIASNTNEVADSREDYVSLFEIIRKAITRSRPVGRQVGESGQVDGIKRIQTDVEIVDPCNNKI